ncbi:MAG: hypothetical protein E7052_09120 [Lentisphaerae bacterium]|nr:hypothetical protein [Lentisphaerota bacterium]
MLKKFAFALSMLMMLSVFAAPEVTIMGQVQHHFKPYGLKVNAFYFKKNTSAAEYAKLVKSIAQSKLVVCAEGATVLNKIFSNKEVKAALDKFFEQGGTFYLWIPSWSWVNSRPLRMYGYFNYLKVQLPVGYAKNKNPQCKITDGFANSWVTAPNKEFDLTANGSNNRPLKGSWQVVFAADNGNPVGFLQEKVRGNGRVFVNYSAMLHNKKAAPFIANLVKNCYGDLPQK